MKKTLFILLLAMNTLTASTTEEVMEYLSLSHSEKAVLEIEQVFNSLRQTQETNETNESTNQVSIVYQEYLEEHISSNEMAKLIQLYHLPIMTRYVAEVKNFNINDDDMDAFLASLEEEPLLSTREDAVDDIVKVLVNEELQLNFYRSMMQRYADNNSSEENNESTMTPREEAYVNAMKKSTKDRLLYGSQVFSLEEVEELKEAIESSIFKKITKVENEALVGIMNNYIQGIISKPKRREKE